MKKRIFALLFVILFILVLSACDVTVEVKGDNSAIVTIKCDEDDIEDADELDPRDLRDMDDLEDLVDEFADYRLDELEITAQSYVHNGDEYTFKIKVLPADDLEDAYYDGITIGSADEVLDLFADDEYGDDFQDIYEEFAEDFDDEYFYAWDGQGDELDDRDVEDYFDNANLENLGCINIYDTDYYVDFIGSEIILNVPGNIEMVFADYDEIDVENNVVEIGESGDVYVIYSKGISTLILIIIIAAVLLLAGGAVLFFVLRKKKKPMVVAAAPGNTVNTQGSKFCVNCGTQMDADDVFCPNCGTRN